MQLCNQVTWTNTIGYLYLVAHLHNPLKQKENIAALIRSSDTNR